jgi:CheY-like chemotaxis protein
MNTTEANRILNMLIADDDKDDWYFVDLAFKELGGGHRIHFVVNGEELMHRLDELHTTGKHEELPDLILLDLNMPKKDGREALREIRSDSRFAHLSIIIYSTTISEQDKAYT